MKVQQIHNAALIKEISTHEKIWDNITEDGAIAPEEYEPDMDNWIWLACTTENDNYTLKLHGIMGFHPMSDTMWQAHALFRPECWGDKRNKKLGRLALDWLFKHNSRVHKIIGIIPDISKETLRFSARIGMKREGVLKKSYLKNGKLHDQYIVSLNRED